MARPTVLDVYPLLDEYAALEQNSNGGSLHIVLMDGNLRSGHVRKVGDLFPWPDKIPALARRPARRDRVAS